MGGSGPGSLVVGWSAGVHGTVGSPSAATRRARAARVDRSELRGSRPRNRDARSAAGRAGFSWAVRRDAEGWKLYEGLSREATTRLTLDQDTAWRFLMRMATAAETRPKVSVEGDPAYAEPFFNAVSAIVRRA